MDQSFVSLIYEALKQSHGPDFAAAFVLEHYEAVLTAAGRATNTDAVPTFQ